MFQLYSSNRLEDLAIMLGRILSVSPPKNAFEQEQVLVQSPGMAQWLKLELAQQHGICAGIAFPLPSTFVWGCFQQSIDDIPSQSEFNKPYIVWRLMRLIDRHLETPEFEPIAWYLSAEESQLRRYQLCNSIADIYDQYLVYRPDWIRLWEANADIKDPKLAQLTQQQPWQAILWRDLVADVASGSGALYHRANLVEALEEVTRSQVKPSSMPERIFVFGIASLPPNTLHALNVMATAGWLEVHVFIMNPCQYYWGDVVDKHYLGRALKKQPEKQGLKVENLHLDANPLLASWGRLGRDYTLQLFNLTQHHLEAFDDQSPTTSSNVSLLAHLQNDVLQLQNHGAEQERSAKILDSSYKHPVALDDKSVSLQICHSPLREIEVLHDQLLALFDADASLTPKDIIVMLPDVNLYAPFIHSVFGQQSDPKKIPYALIDQQAGTENPCIDAYVNLLSIADSRCTFTELFSLLETQGILNHFQLTAKELERLKQWSTEAGVRWGMDTTTGDNLGFESQCANTWENGLRRMLLGYAVGHDAIWSGLLSYGEVEGLEADIAGKLANFLRAIRETIQRLSTPKFPEEWVTFLYQLQKRFFGEDEADSFSQLLSTHIQQITTEWRTAQFNERIEWQVLKQQLAPRLQEPQNNQRFLAGRVNFCTLMPMRSVPFKVICILGLNEGVYPRSVLPVGFDLMVGDFRSGDRSRREDDKYLFLEAMLSAREVFYLSYVGRNIRDNSSLNPSILVSELMEYIGQSSALVNSLSAPVQQSQAEIVQHVMTEHPLQAFNKAYYQPNENGLFSYDEQWLVTLQTEKTASADDPLPAIDLDTDELELDQLIRFYSHPARYFYQRRLKAYLSIRAPEELEDEPFEFNNLEAMQLREAAFNAYSDGTLDAFKERLALSGQMPVGHFGQFAVEELCQQCRAMGQALPGTPQIRWPNIDIQLTFQRPSLAKSTIQVVGWLSRWDQDRRVIHHLSAFSARLKMQVWLEHLAICAQGFGLETQLYCLNKSGSLQVDGYRLMPIDPKQAHEWLSLYLEGYLEGLKKPLILPAKAADIFAQESHKAKGDEEQALAKAMKAYHDTYTGFAEGQDAYWQRCYPNLQEVSETFECLARRYWLPLYDHLEGIE